MRTLLRPWTLATLLGLTYALFVVATQGSPLALVAVGERFKPPEIAYSYSDEGYDGQFVYYIARDPLGAAGHIDVPAYRYQRILLPALGRLAALGQEGLLPWALLAVNLVALAGGTAALETLLASRGASRGYALGYALSVGVLGGLRLTTTETLGYGLVLGALLLATQERWRWSAFCFALAALARETTLLFPAACALWLLIGGRRRAGLAFGLASVLPFILWQFVLLAWLGSTGIGSGGAGATGFELIPLGGYLRILTEGGPLVFLVLTLLLFPFVLLPTLWGLWRCWRDWRSGRSDLYTLLLLANAAVMLFVPFSTYRELLGILRFIVGLQIAVILYAAQRRQQRALRYSTLWFLTTLLLLSEDLGGG